MEITAPYYLVLVFTVMMFNSVSNHLTNHQYSYQLTGNQLDNQQALPLPSNTASIFPQPQQQQQQQQSPFLKPEIKLQQGIVRGTWIRSDVLEKSFLAFLGIPYAAPPVGTLRFKVIKQNI